MKELKPLNFIMLTAAGIINATAIIVFLLPVSLFDTGLSGTAMVLSKFIPIAVPLALFILILNIPFFIFGYKKQGKTFLVYSVYSVCIFSLATFILESVMPSGFSIVSPIAGTDILLCSVFGGLLSGASSGIAIRFGGILDGMEIPAVILSKKMGISVGTFIFIYNVILYCIAGIIMGSWITPLYSIITYFVGVKAMDFIVEGLDRGKSAMIITSKPQKLSEKLSEVFGSGITHIEGVGYYTGDKRTIVYFVVNHFQIGKLKMIVQSVDPTAFISISDVSEIIKKK